MYCFNILVNNIGYNELVRITCKLYAALDKFLLAR